MYGHTHTHLQPYVYISNQEYTPIPELILALHYSMFAHLFSNNEKPGPYYPQRINVFTQFLHMTLISWSQWLSQLWLHWACPLDLLRYWAGQGTACPETNLLWNLSLLSAPFISPRQQERQVEICTYSKLELKGRLRHERCESVLLKSGLTESHRGVSGSVA